MVLASIYGSNALVGYVSGSSLKGPMGATTVACAKLRRGEVAMAARPVAASMRRRRDMNGIVASPFGGSHQAPGFAAMIQWDTNSKYGSGREAVSPTTSRYRGVMVHNCHRIVIFPVTAQTKRAAVKPTFSFFAVG